MENKTIINLLYTDTDYSYAHYFSLNSKLYKLINNQFYYFDTNTNNYIKDEQLDVIFADITLSSVTAIMYSNSQCLVTNDKWYVIDYINSSYTEFTPKYKVSMTGSKFSISEHDGLIYYLSTDGLFVVYNPVNNTYTTYQPCLTYYPYWNSVKDGCIYTISDTGKICVINPIIGFEKEFIDISSYAYETNELIINDGIIHVLGSPLGDSVHLVYELDTDTLYELNDIGECYNPQTDYMFSIDTVLYLIIEGKHYSLSYVKNSSHNIEKIFYVTKDGNACFTGDVVAKSLTLSEDATVEGAIKSTTGEIGGWTINYNSLSTDNITLLSDDYGQIRCKTEDFYALLYDGKYIFGVWDEANPYQAMDKQYVDISAKGLYARGSDTIGYLFEINNDKDTVTVYSTTDDKALSVINFGTGDTLYLQNSEPSYTNAAMKAYIVHDYIYEDDDGVEQKEERSAYVSLLGESENGRIVFRTDLGKGNAYNNSSIGTTNFRWGTGYFGKLYTDSGSITDSDAKIKTIVDDLDNELALTFINNLKPTEYYYNNSNNQRVHMGFIAQEVNKVAKDLDMGNMSIYEAVKVDETGREYYYSDEYSDEELKWSLNYNEFIAPLVGAVQALTKRVEDLEADNEKLRTRIEKLEDVSE